MSATDIDSPEWAVPTAELSQHQYEFNNKLLVRNCKHLQNKQQQEQEHLKRNGYQSKPNKYGSKEDYRHNDAENTDNLGRGFSMESYNSFYEAELNGWPQQQKQQIKFESFNNLKQNYSSSSLGISNISGSRSGKPVEGTTAKGLNGQHLNAANIKTFQHIIYNNDSYETHLTPDNENDDDDDNDNMTKATLSSNKTYKKFVLPLDIPTPPLPLSHNTTKRLLSAHNHNHYTPSNLSNASCQCDKQTNFAQKSTSSSSNTNNNIKNQVNHISFIQTTQKQAAASAASHANTPPSRKENLTLLHNKGSSSSSTLSGSIGCSGLNFNVSDQHLPHHEPLQHHRLCQQKNLKLQHATHQQQRHHQHQQHLQQQPQCQQKLQHQPSLPLYDATYASQQQQQQYLPQLPQLLSINSNNSNYQQNSLTLSHRRMAPTFNRIADKNYMKNLVYSSQRLRRVRIILCVVGCLVLLALLFAPLYFFISSSKEGSPEDNNNSPSNGIQLDDVLQGKLIARHFNGSWSTGSNVIYKENNAIMEFNVVTKQKTRLMLDADEEYTTFEKSADGTYLLLAKKYKKNFRHTYYAEYDIYDIESRQIKPLEIKKESKLLLLVQWAPVGNALIINYERNLYYKPTPFADEIALTDDTNESILNGVPDWVYEEEVFASNSAVWFSPDGKKIAFIQFDDSPTHIINFPIYGEAGDLRFQYPYNRLVAYPKAGSPNPRVKLFTSDLDRAAAGNTDHLTNIPVPSALNTESDYIITVVGWLNNTNVLSIWMNRIQNQAHIQIFNGLRRQNVYSLESKTGWIDFFAPPFKNRDGNRIAFVLPQAQETGGEYRHLCVLSTSSSNAKPEALTKGKYTVNSILNWDSTHDIIFYSANMEDKTEQSHVYAIKAATGQTAKCLTCNLIKSNGIAQTYYTAEFNNKNQVLINAVGPSIPQVVIYEWSYANNQVSLNKLVTWEDNEALRTSISKYAMPTHEIHTLPIAEGFTAKVLLQLPPNMDRSGKTKYPMLVDVYGGPDSYSVTNRWMVDWGTYLTSDQSVIYAKIDGRGSGLRGEKLLHSVYLKLGTVEIADQINVTRQLQQKFNFIDANHTGIWGWSYGGYAAAMALANDNEHVFRCAASIAPVTDWAYYDSIYTERYMGLPNINELSYAASRLSTKATQLRGKKFLLIHGTLDDNVHYQQAMILAKNLERNDILFKQITYPDEDHALGGVRPHLYHSLDRFFGECFASNRMTHSKWN